MRLVRCNSHKITIAIQCDTLTKAGNWARPPINSVILFLVQFLRHFIFPQDALINNGVIWNRNLNTLQNTFSSYNSLKRVHFKDTQT